MSDEKQENKNTWNTISIKSVFIEYVNITYSKYLFLWSKLNYVELLKCLNNITFLYYKYM